MCICHLPRSTIETAEAEPGAFASAVRACLSTDWGIAGVETSQETSLRCTA